MSTETRRRVLYGLRGGGTGYRQQARLLEAAFTDAGASVDFLVSGPGKARLLSAEALREQSVGEDPLRLRDALPESGALPSCAASLRFLRGVEGFDMERYEFVLSESEPLSVWASRLHQVPCFSVGHAATVATGAAHPVTEAKRWPHRRLPTSGALATYWYPVHPTVLPPLVDTRLSRMRIVQDFTLVFLPEEELPPLVSLLSQLRSKHFVVYSPAVERASQWQNVSLYPACEANFRLHLERTNRLICHVDAELIAQALHVGLPLLVKPASGRAERKADVHALLERRLGRVVRTLGPLNLERFIESAGGRQPMDYPDVAREIAYQCLHDDPRDVERLAARLWAPAAARREASAQLAGEAA